jgi:hypothetical protein
MKLFNVLLACAGAAIVSAVPFHDTLLVTRQSVRSYLFYSGTPKFWITVTTAAGTGLTALTALTSITVKKLTTM